MNETDELKTESTYEIKRPKHLKISRRDTMVNDWKNSTGQGICSFILSLISAGILLMAVYISYKSAGAAGYITGILALMSFTLAVIAVILGIVGLRNRHKIRHYMERRGLILSGIIVIGLIVLFIKGIGTLNL